jgi:hypothetical protein
MGHHRRVPSFSNYTKTWEPKVAEAVRQKVEHLLEESKSDGFDESRPYMISLSGIPGSGM